MEWSTPIAAQLVIVGALVLLNGFFVAAEFSLVSVRGSRVEQLVAEGHAAARGVQTALRDLDRYIAGTQVGITMASIGLGWVGEPALAHLLEPLLQWVPVPLAKVTAHGIAIGIAFATVTILHVVFGELVPKSLALQRTETTALRIAKPMQFTVWLLRPLIWSLNGCGNMVLRLMGLEPAGEHQAVHSVEELQILARHSHEAGVLDDMQRDLLARSLLLPDLTAKDVMVPRPDIVALEVTLSADEVLDRAAQTVHTRLPVCDGSLDSIVGVLHLQDLLRRVRQSPEEVDLRSLVRPAHLVPQTIRVEALLKTFRDRHTQMSLVLDEHGGVAGLVTLEDVVDELFGELQDELESVEPGIRQTQDGRVSVRGDVHLRELSEQLGWELHDEAARTVAGYVMNRLGRTARPGDTVETPHGTIGVAEMEGLRITVVAITPKAALVNGALKDNGDLSEEL